MVKEDSKLRYTIRDKPPCAFCPPEEKYTACHDTCGRFAEWKAEVERVKKNKTEYYKTLPKFFFRGG